MYFIFILSDFVWVSYWTVVNEVLMFNGGRKSRIVETFFDMFFELHFV